MKTTHETVKHTIYAVIPIENHDFFIEQQTSATNCIQCIQIEEREIFVKKLGCIGFSKE